MFFPLLSPCFLFSILTYRHAAKRNKIRIHFAVGPKTLRATGVCRSAYAHVAYAHTDTLFYTRPYIYLRFFFMYLAISRDYGASANRFAYIADR